MDPRNIIRNPSTQSAVHDYTKAKELQDAERRRAELDKMRATAKDPGPGAHARLSTRSLGGLASHAVVVVKIVHPDKSTRTWVICELSIDKDGLALIIACPSCIFRHHRSSAQSQLTMRSWHRKFVLDAHGAGNIWVNPENPAEVVTLAGVIETVDVQTCPVCSLKFHLEKSRDPADVAGMTVLREA